MSSHSNKKKKREREKIYIYITLELWKYVDCMSWLYEVEGSPHVDNGGFSVTSN